MSLAFYKGFSAFSLVGVIITGTTILLAPEVGCQSLGVQASTDSATNILLASCHFAWAASKANAYLSGYKSHQRYFRLTLPAVVLWWYAAMQSQNNPTAYILPGIMMPAYLYYGYFFPFDRYREQNTDPSAKKE